MVPLLLFLILLVLAWPVFAIFGGTLIAMVLSHLSIIIPTVLVTLAYIAFLAPIAKRNNIKLGGKLGEALDPAQPTGAEFRRLREPSANLSPSFFNNPSQWRPVSGHPEDFIQQKQVMPPLKRRSLKRGILLATVIFFIALPLTVIVTDQVMRGSKNSESSVPRPPDVQATSQVIVPTGRWLVQTGQSAALQATSGTNYLGQPVSLSANCLRGSLELKFQFHDYLGPDKGWEDYKTVFVGFGAVDLHPVRMMLGPDQTTLLAMGKSREMIEKLRSEYGIRLYIEPFNAEPIEASFDTTGAKAALSSVLDACPPPAAYTLPEKALISFNGDGGVIRVLSTGDIFPFTANSPPGVEMLYGDCRMALGQYCEVGLKLDGNKLERIWSARVSVGAE